MCQRCQGARYRLSLRARVTGDKIFRPQVSYGLTPLAEHPKSVRARACSSNAHEGWNDYSFEANQYGEQRLC